MRIAGIYPQKIESDPKIQHAVSEPYGLESILAIAKQDGHEVDLFLPLEERDGNLISIGENEFTENIVKFNPDIAAFSLYTSQYPMGERVAKELKKRLPRIVTVAGNRYPSFLRERIEEPFDFFVVKEGETTFQEFLFELTNKQNFERIKGLVIRKNGKGVYTGIRERNFNLDSLPNALRFPIILNQVYRGISIPSISLAPHYAVVESSRCCYNNCNFCDNNGFWGNKVAFKSSKRVIDELFELKEKGVDIFYFMDLNFTSLPEKTQEICEEMIKQKLNASWYCMSNIATVDGNFDLLYLMKSAGCYKIAWGVESTNDNALHKMNKKVGERLTTNSQTARVLESSLEAGIVNQGFYIIAFPWETEESILEDAQGLANLPLHQLNIGIFTPIPLSRFYNEMIRDCYVFSQDLEKHDRNTLIYNHKTLTNEKIKALQKKIHADFYKNPNYLETVKKTCSIDPRFRQSFNDYFEFLGVKSRV